jgi:hypothetical protein
MLMRAGINDLLGMGGLIELAKASNLYVSRIGDDEFAVLRRHHLDRGKPLFIGSAAEVTRWVGRHQVSSRR